MLLFISEKVENALKLPEKDREKELLMLLAVKLYEKGAISLGKAAEMCGMNSRAFLALLAREEMCLNYDEAELEQDLKNRESFR